MTDYVLGTGLDERERLGLQHRLWSDDALAAWKRARIGPGASVLDIGCGPGHAAFDLAQLVTSHGRVVGVDASQPFIDYLTEQAAARGLPQLKGAVSDATDLHRVLEKEPPFDAAWARWVFCFLPDPDAVVASLVQTLKPGARLIVHDYFNYASMTFAPHRRSFDRVVEATVTSWKSAGGDPDVAAKLPSLFAKHGLRTEHLAMHQRVARGGDPMYAWPDSWWRTYAPKLVAMGLFSQADCDELFNDLTEVARSKTEYIVTPPVTEIIAVKE